MRANGSAGSAFVEDQVAHRDQFHENRRRNSQRGIHAYGAAGHGRIEFVRRSDGVDFREDSGLSAIAGARLNRSGARFARWKARSISRRRCSSFRASPAARSSPTFSSNISSSARSRRQVRRRQGSSSSRLPIQVRICRKWRKADHFRHIFFGLPSIGGRYSALSNFGMIPGAIQGVDIPKFLDQHGRNGSRVRVRGPGRPKSRRDSGGDSWDAATIRARQSDALHVAGNFMISARGSNSCLRNRRVSKGRG